MRNAICACPDTFVSPRPAGVKFAALFERQGMPFLSRAVKERALGGLAHPALCRFLNWSGHTVPRRARADESLFWLRVSFLRFCTLPFVLASLGVVVRTVSNVKRLYVLRRPGKRLGRQVVRASKLRGSSRPAEYIAWRPFG